MKTSEFNKKKKKVSLLKDSRKELQKWGRIRAKQKGTAFRTKKINGQWRLIEVFDKKRKQVKSAKQKKIDIKFMRSLRKKEPTLRKKSKKQQFSASLPDEIQGYYLFDKITEPSGWITPDGRFIEVEYHEHDDAAMKIGKELYDSNSLANFEEQGWLRYSGDYILVVKGYGTKIGRKGTLTGRQENLLYDFMVENNMDEVEFSIHEKMKDGKHIVTWKKVKRKDLFSQEFAIADFEVSNEITNHSGLISPDGKFYECDFGGHSNAGAELAKELYGEDSLEDLEKRGWIELSEYDIKKLEKIGTKYPKLTNKQIDMLIDFFYDSGFPNITLEKIILSRRGDYISSERDRIKRKELLDYLQEFASKKKQWKRHPNNVWKNKSTGEIVRIDKYDDEGGRWYMTTKLTEDTRDVIISESSRYYGDALFYVKEYTKEEE